MLPDGDGGGGDEHEDENDEDDDAQSVFNVSGADGELAGAGAVVVAEAVGWIELSRWPRCVMRLAPKVTSRPGVAAKHRDTSEAQRV